MPPSVSEQLGEPPKSPVVKKTVFFFLILLCAWTATKIPFLMAYDPSSEYAHTVGLSGSINLVHWIHGYTASKLKSPVVSFFLLHVVMGINTLVLVAATLIYPSWRRRYGVWTFAFAIVFCLHALPGSLEHFLRVPFATTCVYVILTAVWGLRTLYKYEESPLVSEKRLELQHYIIAFGLFGAGFTELFASIVPNFVHYATTGAWPTPNYPGPHPQTGHTWYDRYMPEWLGWFVYWVLVLVTWVAIPTYFVTISAETAEQLVANHQSAVQNTEEEATPITSSAEAEQTNYGTLSASSDEKVVPKDLEVVRSEGSSDEAQAKKPLLGTS